MQHNLAFYKSYIHYLLCNAVLDNLYFTNYEFGQLCGYVAGICRVQGEEWEFNGDCFDIPVDWEQFHNFLNENSAALKEGNIQELSPMAQLFLGWEPIGDPDDNGDVSMFSVRVEGSPQQIAAEASRHDLISLCLCGKSEFFIQTYRRMKYALVSFEKMSLPQSPTLPTKSDRFPLTNIDCTSSQTMSPKEKREVCALIRKDAENNKYSAFASNCTVFDFSDFTLKRSGDVYFTGDIVFEIAALGDEMTSGYGFPEIARYDMRVLVGDYKDSVRAFLEIGNAHGNPRIVELAKFNILTTFNVEGKDLAVQMVFHREDEIVDFEIFAASPRSTHLLRSDISVDAKVPRNKVFYFTA